MSDNGQREPNDRVCDGTDPLERGRDAYCRQAWDDAYRWLSLADEVTPFEPLDLERLAMSAYLAGKDDEYLQALDRAHQAYLNTGQCVRAARCAFWLGLRLAFRGETGPATGWFARAERLLQREGRACVEEGYLLLPIVERQLRSGNAETAYAMATRAAEIGDRFGEADLSACARHVQGRALILQGQVGRGLALLDEAMVAVTVGDLSPIMTGLIYCSVIDVCQCIYAMDRAREWTSALAKWCAGQPQLVTFTGTCLVHRAEIMQMSGAWRDAIEEARRACAAFSKGSQQIPVAAYYQQGEVHRLRGEFRDAEEAYRRASRHGYEPQPGLSLLRLAQGCTEAAAVAIHRAVSTTTDRLQRVKILPAYIEIMLAAGELENARSGCRELEESAATFDTVVLRAMAVQARGAVNLAEGAIREALVSLRCALQLWQQMAAPYHVARVRELMASACRALGDEEAAELELEAARLAFEELGALSDLTRIGSSKRIALPAGDSGLSPRELQVLRLVATGKSNKAIASELHLSGKTIDRHVSSILTKLDVSSRTAATAWAYENKIL